MSWTSRSWDENFPIIGYILRSDPDTINTAYPNLVTAPSQRKIQITPPQSQCGLTGGVDVRGGPPNDNFDQAQMLNGDGGPIQASLEGATAQSNEPGQASRSIWYCWTATENSVNNGCFPEDTASFDLYSLINGSISGPPPELTVWAGTQFDSLQLVTRAVGGLSFPANAGGTFVLQVSDPGGSPPLPVPADFDLTWPTGCG